MRVYNKDTDWNIDPLSGGLGPVFLKISSSTDLFFPEIHVKLLLKGSLLAYRNSFWVVCRYTEGNNAAQTMALILHF